jgi:predicted transcriptional regulator
MKIKAVCYNDHEVIKMLKDDVKQMIDKLPEDCSIEDIQYTLYVRSKIQKGLKDLDEGNVLTTEEVKARMDKWLNK